MGHTSHNLESLRRYEKNINNVITYISQHLQDEITLDCLSSVSHFSKFHFSRLFKSFTGETPGEFIRRLRLEKAAYLLVYNSVQSITHIAIDCGFSSSQNLSKAFKQHFGTTPSAYRAHRKDIPLTSSSSLPSTNGNERSSLSYARITSNRNTPPVQLLGNPHADPILKVIVKEFPDMQVAYARGIGPYSPELVVHTMGRLIQWGQPRGIVDGGSSLFSVFWDNAAITPEDKCRVDCCVSYSGTDLIDGVQSQTLTGGAFAVYSCEIENDNFYIHWNRLLKQWLPLSGYELDDRPSYEIYKNIFSYPKENLKMDICIPVT